MVVLFGILKFVEVLGGELEEWIVVLLVRHSLELVVIT